MNGSMDRGMNGWPNGVKVAWMAVLLAAFLAGQFIALMRETEVAFYKKYMTPTS
jgi:hypothetical protein